MFLITTADQRFWRTNDRVLFLGEWCKLFSQRGVWEKMDYEVLPYHWNDREKLFNDYLYLDKLYEKMLGQLAGVLNDIHGVNHSTRYWRIIVGSWLCYFIQMLYDRYQSISTAIQYAGIKNTLICNDHAGAWLPNDFRGFLQAYIDDAYNHYIYSRIIESTRTIKFEVVEGSDQQLGYIKPQNDFLRRYLKRLTAFSGRFVPARLNKIVLVSTYLSLMDLIRLQMSLRQIPYVFPPQIEVPRFKIDPCKRKRLSFALSEDVFERFLAQIIGKQLPLIYLEGYQEMQHLSLKAYPRNPKVIFTANAFSSNEPFKFWAAHHVDEDVKFVGTQHGGHYGTGLWSSADTHEIKIYDYFYTWGWRSKIHENTKPLAAAKLNNVNGIRAKSDGRILMALSTMPRYAYHMYSVPVAASGTLSYFNDQYPFVKALSGENRRLIVVRLYGLDYKWCQESRWQDECPEVETYMGKQSIFDQLKESRLLVATYNATTYLESFAANFPTVMFWNPQHWELNETAQPYFDDLRTAGILHDTPESAASLVNEIANDSLSWWHQTNIQDAKDRFCRQYAKMSDSWLQEWKRELTDLATTH